MNIKADRPKSILANAGSTGIAHHPIIVGPVEANTAKLELAFHAAQLRIGDSLDHILQVAVTRLNALRAWTRTRFPCSLPNR